MTEFDASASIPAQADAPTGPTVDAANDAAQAAPEHVGQILARRREALDMSVDAVAGRLKTGARLIEAIEAARWEEFASPTLLRGFVRAYAKAVDLDPHALMEALPHGVDPAASLSLRPTLSAPLRQGMQGHALRWWTRSLGVGALVVGAAIVVGKFGLNPFVGTATDPARDRSAPLRTPSPLSVEIPLAANAVPVEPSAPAPSAPTSPALAALAPSPAAPNTISQAPQTVSASPVSAPGAAIPVPVEVRASAASVANVLAPQLRINVERESWVEVTDSGGHILLSSLQPAGARQDVNGRAPLTIVIGNAPGVHVEYGGKSVDLAPYTRGHVARLALN